MELEYKSKTSLLERTVESQRVLFKYPDRIPVIIESNDPKIPKLSKNKYLVPKDLTIGQLLYILRRHIKLEATEAIFLFVRNTLPPTSYFVSQLYEMYRDVDGFLYLQYRSENAFGSS